jgi:hypothetical protein
MDGFLGALYTLFVLPIWLGVACAIIWLLDKLGISINQVAVISIICVCAYAQIVLVITIVENDN